VDAVVTHRRRIWLYALSGLLILYLVLPVFIVVPMSFSASRFLEFPPSQWSMRWYTRFFASVDWYTSMLVSLKVACLTTVTSLPLGVAAAYAIKNGEHWAFRRLYAILLLPTMVPNMIIAIGIFYVYVRLNWLGTIHGLVLADLMMALPFVLVTSLSGLRACDMTQELVARSLGCTRLGAFWSVTLPQIRGSIVIGALFAFITSFDEVIIALFIASGQNLTITKVMFDSLHEEIDPTIAAASSMLIGGSIVVASIAMLSARLGAKGALRERAADPEAGR